MERFLLERLSAQELRLLQHLVSLEDSFNPVEVYHYGQTIDADAFSFYQLFFGLLYMRCIEVLPALVLPRGVIMHYNSYVISMKGITALKLYEDNY